MNIAVFTKNWIGDVVFQSCAIDALKKNFPDSTLIVIAPKRCVGVLEENPNVDEIIPFDDRNDDKSWSRKWRLVQHLRALKIDRIYLFHRSFSRSLIAFLAGIPNRVGYNTKARGFLLTHSIREPERPVHSVLYFMHLLRSSGLKINGDYQYHFHYSKNDLEFAKALLAENGLRSGQLVAMNPGANWLPKRWPVASYQELARRLVAEYRVQVIVAGSANDSELAQAIISGADRGSIVSLCGKTNLRQLGALFSLCRLLISNDSGPLHIGGGVGVNVIGIFGPTDPKLTGPLGRGKNIVIHYAPDGAKVPWYGKTFPYGEWMERISVDQVMETIKREKLLDETKDENRSFDH